MAKDDCLVASVRENWYEQLKKFDSYFFRLANQWLDSHANKINDLMVLRSIFTVPVYVQFLIGMTIFNCNNPIDLFVELLETEVSEFRSKRLLLTFSNEVAN